MLMSEEPRLVIGGVALDLFGALALTRLLPSQLFGLDARDPLICVDAPMVLLSAASIACVLPARSAAR
ncbi:MAG: hypothetical protein ABJB66_16295 [Gemmatimonadaceae bacterium]